MAQLIADDKSDKALDLCKDIHRRRQSTDSEALLLEAYDARFRTLLKRNLEFDAKSLMALVRDRYPSATGRLAEWSFVMAARHGDLNTLLAPLNDPSLPLERHAAISAAVRSNAVDLRALAECRVLAPEHPLRTAAAALWKAFDAVTRGLVAEEDLALPEVSRQSPLAPWKMLIRAIAHYYRRDDAMCEKYLEAVESDSAAARLAPALHALVHQKEQHKSQTLTPAASALVSRTGGDFEKLHDALRTLDQALDRGKLAQALPGIRTAMTVCQQAEPGLLQRLKQHISVRAMLAGLKPEPVITALQGPSLKNAYFWRLLARAHEEADNPAAIPFSCSLWEEFRKHAIHEGWFPARGPEVAALYVHMADLWRRVSPDIVEDLQDRFAAHYSGHADYYRGQPPEIRALMSKSDNPDLYFLLPFAALERACQADPCSENFQRWLRSAVDNSSDFCDQVAESWSQALPLDIPPLLHLMGSAEKRNALKKAFGYMERAEQIDGLNSDVRRARLRLLVSMAIRHLKDRKARLAEGELRQLEALPQAQQGDRPAFISALRWAWGQSGGAMNDINESRVQVLNMLGSELAAQIVFRGVSLRCELRVIAEVSLPPKGTPLSAAIGRACALGDDMGMAFEIPQNLFNRLEKELSANDFSAPVGPLMALGEAAIRQNLLKMAYAIAGAGLAQGNEGQGRFLYLRARGLPPGDRRAACLQGASELARRQRDSDLLNRIGEWRDEEMDWLDGPPDVKNTISAEEIARLVEREAKERGYPKWQPEDNVQDDDDCPCPACRARRGDRGMPPGLEMPPVLEEMVGQFGPEVVAQALAEIVGMGGFGGPGGKGKRRKRRSPIWDDNDVLPF